MSGWLYKSYRLTKTTEWCEWDHDTITYLNASLKCNVQLFSLTQFSQKMDYNQNIIQLPHIMGYQNPDPVLNQSKCRLQILNWIYGIKTLFHFRLSQSCIISFIPKRSSVFKNRNSHVRKMICYCYCCSIECLLRHKFGKGCDFKMCHENFRSISRKEAF